MKLLAERRQESNGNYGSWDSAIKHLEKFTGGTDVTFRQVISTWLEQVRTYFRKEARMSNGRPLSQTLNIHTSKRFALQLDKQYWTTSLSTILLTKWRVSNRESRNENSSLMKSSRKWQKQNAPYPFWKRPFSSTPWLAFDGLTYRSWPGRRYNTLRRLDIISGSGRRKPRERRRYRSTKTLSHYSASEVSPMNESSPDLSTVHGIMWNCLNGQCVPELADDHIPLCPPYIFDTAAHVENGHLHDVEIAGSQGIKDDADLCEGDWREEERGSIQNQVRYIRLTQPRAYRTKNKRKKKKGAEVLGVVDQCVIIPNRDWNFCTTRRFNHVWAAFFASLTHMGKWIGCRWHPKKSAPRPTDNGIPLFSFFSFSTIYKMNNVRQWFTMPFKMVRLPGVAACPMFNQAFWKLRLEWTLPP